MAGTTALIRRTRTNRFRWLGFLGAALLATTLAAGPVSATIIDRGNSTEHYEYDSWDCGYRMHVTGVVSDAFQVRADKKNPDIVYATTHHAFTETWTADDGRWFTLSGHNLYKDIKAKAVAGQLYEFTFHIPGQPFTITNSSGKVVSKDRGNVSFEYTIDFADGTGTDVGFKLSGPHPSFGVDTCLLVAPLTGWNSARYLTPRPIGSTPFANGYDEYLPPSYTPNGPKSPLLLFFNGSGENGDGTRRLSTNCSWPASRSTSTSAAGTPPDRSSCSPCSTSRSLASTSRRARRSPWGGSCGMQLLHDRGNVQPAPCTLPDEVRDFIGYALANYNVDPSRVYITGHSCGGYGVWEYLAKYGADRKVAAAVPMAGDGRPGNRADYCALGATPLWAFHGALDDVVDPQGSIEPMTALQACPGVAADRARLTVFPIATTSAAGIRRTEERPATSTSGCWLQQALTGSAASRLWRARGPGAVCLEVLGEPVLVVHPSRSCGFGRVMSIDRDRTPASTDGSSTPGQLTPARRRGRAGWGRSAGASADRRPIGW